MLNDKVRAEVEQSGEFLAEALPPLWRNLYEGCIGKGFTDSESLELVKTYILAQATNGVNGT